jgi:light-regulated signal transduction histidine kinase (bacteriophytochrome)
LTSKGKAAKGGDQFEFYMDLLSHDILNSHQAVLSYLELIIANPNVDKKSKVLAEKAIGHIRGSTLLIENIKKIVSSRGEDFTAMKPVDLVKNIGRAQVDLQRFYPGKRIRIDHKQLPRVVMVYGGNYVDDLVLNVLVSAIRLNQGDDIRLNFAVEEGVFAGDPAWIIQVEDPDSQLPPFLNGQGVAATYAQDSSLAVKSSGLLSSKMIATNLGGDFDAHAITREPKRKGAVFTITLRRADKP